MAKKANKVNCEGYEHHMMYDNKTGKGVMTSSCQQHLDLMATHSHDKPKKRFGGAIMKSGGQVQGCGCPYGMEMGPNNLL